MAASGAKQNKKAKRGGDGGNRGSDGRSAVEKNRKRKRAPSADDGNKVQGSGGDALDGDFDVKFTPGSARRRKSRDADAAETSSGVDDGGEARQQHDSDNDTPEAVNERKQSKKRRRAQEHRKRRQALYQKRQEQKGEVRFADAAEQAENVRQWLKDTRKATALVLSFDESAFVPVSREQLAERVPNSLAAAVRLVEPEHATTLGGRYDATETRGAPRIIVVSASAIDASHHYSALVKSRLVASPLMCAKLFGKHLKLADQTKALAKTVVRLGAGTPHRVRMLVEAEALKLDNLSLVIVDMSLNAKRQSIFDERQSAVALCELLASPLLNDRIANGHTKLVLF